MRYADAGVKSQLQIKPSGDADGQKTFTRGVLAPIGGFGRSSSSTEALARSDSGGSAMALDELKIAFATGIHSTVGADILNHCVNAS